jgi:hyperosmotically inducible periplasmic protein
MRFALACLVWSWQRLFDSLIGSQRTRERKIKEKNQMAYQEQQAERRRVVVETPNTRREVVHSEAVRSPERTGVSGAALAAIVIGVIALAAVIILFVLNQQQQTADNANIAAQQQPAQQQPVIVQQPAPQQPVIVQQPAAPGQAPVIVNNPPQPSSGGVTDGDSAIQAAIDKKFADDEALKALNVTTMVINGKVTLMGTVKSEQQKAQVERVVRNIKGVKSVDNQLSVG